jgi:hypothetical protein
MIGAEHRNPRRRGRSRLPRLVALALCLAGLLVPAWSAPAPAAAAQARGVGNPVLDWNPIAQEAIAVGRPRPAARSWPPSSRWPSTTP